MSMIWLTRKNKVKKKIVMKKKRREYENLSKNDKTINGIKIQKSGFKVNDSVACINDIIK